MRPARRTSEQVGLEYGWRSGLEASVAAQLREDGIAFTYEEVVLEFQQPTKKRKYTPDFVITTRSGKEIVVETKGRFLVADRQKMELVFAQFPEHDIRIVFSNPNQRISKASKTRYRDWCDSRGILWATRHVPQEWLDE